MGSYYFGQQVIVSDFVIGIEKSVLLAGPGCEISNLFTRDLIDLYNIL